LSESTEHILELVTRVRDESSELLERLGATSTAAAEQAQVAFEKAQAVIDDLGPSGEASAEQLRNAVLDTEEATQALEDASTAALGAVTRGAANAGTEMAHLGDAGDRAGEAIEASMAGAATAVEHVKHAAGEAAAEMAGIGPAVEGIGSRGRPGGSGRGTSSVLENVARRASGLGREVQKMSREIDSASRLANAEADKMATSFVKLGANVAKNAAAFSQMGASFGPWGIAIGAAVGVAVAGLPTLLGYLKGTDKQLEETAKKAKAQFEEMLKTIQKDVSDSTREVQKLADALEAAQRNAASQGGKSVTGADVAAEREGAEKLVGTYNKLLEAKDKFAATNQTMVGLNRALVDANNELEAIKEEFGAASLEATTVAKTVEELRNKILELTPAYEQQVRTIAALTAQNEALDKLTEQRKKNEAEILKINEQQVDRKRVEAEIGRIEAEKKKVAEDINREAEAATAKQEQQLLKLQEEFEQRVATLALTKEQKELGSDYKLITELTTAGFSAQADTLRDLVTTTRQREEIEKRLLKAIEDYAKEVEKIVTLNAKVASDVADRVALSQAENREQREIVEWEIRKRSLKEQGYTQDQINRVREAEQNEKTREANEASLEAQKRKWEGEAKFQEGLERQLDSLRGATDEDTRRLAIVRELQDAYEKGGERALDLAKQIAEVENQRRAQAQADAANSQAKTRAEEFMGRGRENKRAHRERNLKNQGRWKTAADFAPPDIEDLADQAETRSTQDELSKPWDTGWEGGQKTADRNKSRGNRLAGQIGIGDKAAEAAGQAAGAGVLGSLGATPTIPTDGLKEQAKALADEITRAGGDIGKAVEALTTSAREQEKVTAGLKTHSEQSKALSDNVSKSADAMEQLVSVVGSGFTTVDGRLKALEKTLKEQADKIQLAAKGG
jgi:hypothetical protein